MQLSLRTKYVLSFGIAAILLAAMIIYVNGHNTDASNGQQLTPQGRASANRLAIILAEQEQAPHVLHADPAAAPRDAISHAVRVQMNGLINNQEAGPPLSPARCFATHAGGGQVQGFSCTDLSGGQYFDFVGVVDSATHVVTVCRRDPPPVQSQSVPVSTRCLS